MDYWIEENDGNGDLKVFVPAGSVYIVQDVSELPGNFRGFYTDKFDQIFLRDLI